MSAAAVIDLVAGGPAVGTPAAYLLIYVLPGVILLVLGGVATVLTRLTKAVTLLVHEVMPPERPSLREEVTTLRTDVAVMRATQVRRTPDGTPGGP